MKIGKIILAVILLFSVGNEFIRAGFQIGNFFNLGIILGILLVLVLIAWLFGSAVSKTKMPLKSWTFLKYYFISFIAFIVVAFFSMANHKAPKEIVEYNGIKISIEKFYANTKRICPNDEDRKKYVLCVVEKLANSEEIVKKYRHELEIGNIYVILENPANFDLLNNLEIVECNSLIDINWTDGIKKRMTQSYKSYLIGTEMEKTVNIDGYCNCIVEKLSIYPYNEAISKEFTESEKYRAIIDSCALENKK